MSLERDLLANTITPRPRKKSSRRAALIAALIIAIVIAAAAGVTTVASRRADAANARLAIAEQVMSESERAARQDEERAVAAFLQRQKVITPAQLAAAIVKVTRDRREQRLLASVAVVESRGNPAAKGQRGEIGAYQVRPELHGPVPADLEGQTEQALAILRSHTDRYGIRSGVKSYNGSGKAADRYATTVLAYAGEIQ